jgi:plasmid stabilization system protein ParE
MSTAFDFVAAENLSAAKRQDEIIVRVITRLADFPQLGRVGRIAGTRELVIAGTPYIAAYAVLDGAIAVFAILHGAQRWPVRL